MLINSLKHSPVWFQRVLIEVCSILCHSETRREDRGNTFTLKAITMRYVLSSYPFGKEGITIRGR